MRFTADREALFAALAFVDRCVSSRATIEILKTVKVEASGEGVTLTGTDLEQSARDSFPAQVETEGAVCLPSAMLLSAIKSSKASEVLIDATGPQVVVVIGGKTKLKVGQLSGDDFPNQMPMLTSDGAVSFTIDASLLDKVKRRVSFAEESRDASRFYLMGTSWAVDGEYIEFCATNGKMLGFLREPAPVPEMPHVIVPTCDMPSWVGDVSVVVSENFVRFSRGSQVFATKVVEGSFPDYHRVFQDHQTKLLFDREELRSAVARMQIVGTLILLVGRDGRVTLSARSDGREISDEIAYEGDDFQISVTSTLMAPTLDSFDCEVIEMWIDGHRNPATIHDPSDDSRLAIVYPYNDPRIVEYLPQEKQDAE